MSGKGQFLLVGFLFLLAAAIPLVGRDRIFPMNSTRASCFWEVEETARSALNNASIGPWLELEYNGTVVSINASGQVDMHLFNGTDIECSGNCLKNMTGNLSLLWDGIRVPITKGRLVASHGRHGCQKKVFIWEQENK